MTRIKDLVCQENSFVILWKVEKERRRLWVLLIHKFAPSSLQDDWRGLLAY